MAWIKRNLLFVISVAVGLLLTGYCGYLLYSSLDANSGVSDEFRSTLSNLQAMQQKSPYPSSENIEAARADQKHVREFLTDFRKKFVAFPAPPVEDERGFKTYLDDSLIRFRADATNAGVQLPADFSFAFAGLLGKLTYPPSNIAPWMQQLEEISAILDILYRAKINYLSSLCRVPISPDDVPGPGDCLLQQAAMVTNQLGIVTPYQVTFHGFSAEIAAVMEGFARSSNCFIIKGIDVKPLNPNGTSDRPSMQGMAQVMPEQSMPRNFPSPRFVSPPPNRPGRGDRGFPGMMRQAPPPTAAPPVASVVVSSVASAPVTFLSESVLAVTISVDVVKLKASDH